MKRIIVILALLMLLAGCASQTTEQKYDSPEPSDITQENSSEQFTEPIESFNSDDIEYSEYSVEKEDEISSISKETNLPRWSDISNVMPNNSYTIEYQRKLPGRSFIGCAESFDIVEKDNKIFVKTYEFEACYGVMYIEITEEQLQSILMTDNINGFIYSFTISNVSFYDIGIDAEREENEDVDYISVDGVPRSIIIYGTCNEIYKLL